VVFSLRILSSASAVSRTSGGISPPLADSLLHSLLEEYYWRWFVFGQLHRLIALWPAIMISALAFMGHHVVVLGVYLTETPRVAWIISAAVAIGGGFWAWL
jgi:uncharacterized protein